MTPEEFGNIYQEMENELKAASNNPASISETIVCTYIMLKFKKSAQEGVMNSFRELSESFGKVLASQTMNINNTTAEMLNALLERMISMEKKILDLNN